MPPTTGRPTLNLNSRRGPRLLASLAIAASCLLALACVALFGPSLYISLFPQPAYDTSAYVDTWLDSDSNGHWEPEEGPLASVCVFALPSGHEPTAASAIEWCLAAGDAFRTDQTGHWPHADDHIRAVNFFAGSKCQDLWIVTVPPVGFKHTTPSAVNSCTATFGFAPIDGQ